MKIKIIVQSRDSETGYRAASEVWSGELAIEKETEYIVKISMIGVEENSQPQPLCDIPFAIGIGHYMWIPPEPSLEMTDDSYSLT